MMKKNINQKNISLIEYYKMANLDIIISDDPIARYKKEKNTNSVFNKKEKLNILKKKIENIENCNLKKTANKMVFSDGNMNSKIMFIGEGPGAQEDRIGLPFVGDAGKLLDKMMEAINLNRNKVYISNVVNYRPPSNRKPTEEEIERYLPFLKLHIEIIKPRILVLLGSTALQAISRKEKIISKVRGKWFKSKIGECEPEIIVTFHPAYLIRQPEQKKKSWNDLKLIRDKIKILKL
tara:strand:- start:34 stop:741 length:708 start_codon:yes stop_codon:yes gene_type:complete